MGLTISKRPGCGIGSEGRDPGRRGWCKSEALICHLITTTVRIPLFYHHLPHSVRAKLSFRVSVPPKRHLQINEKCHNRFCSSKTAAPLSFVTNCLCCSLLLAGPAPGPGRSLLTSPGPFRRSQGKPLDNDLSLMQPEPFSFSVPLSVLSSRRDCLCSEQEVGVLVRLVKMVG